MELSKKRRGQEGIDGLFQRASCLRWLIIDEISGVGLLTLGVMETNLRRVCRTSHAYARRADKTWRPFGGINVLCFGDWWQLPPVKAVAIFSNPFAAHENVERRMLQHFWVRDKDAFQQLFELQRAYRFDKDPWLKQVLTQHRHGKETWETYCFVHG